MGLGTLDLLIVAIYLVGITLFGLRFRKSERSLKSYFLADRTVPWWAIALSIVSAETSTLTIISIPGLAYDTDFSFLQVVIGYMVARIVISAIFLPAYFKGELFTAYQLIDKRFGRTLHKLTAGIFLATRAVAEGVRVFAISIVVNIAIERYLLQFMSRESSVIFSIGLVTLLTLIYTFEGGMTAVIWTDVVQMGIYIGGTLVGFYTLLHLVPGGWGTIADQAGAAGKFHIFDFAPSLTKTFNFWAGVIGGTFLTTASHGTDQLMVQRLLAAKSQAESRLALLSSGGAILMQFTLFLLVGASLYVFYQMFPPAAPFGRSDRIFPTFIVSQMPMGISGLLIAAILAAAMSNLSAALNSLSSTTVMDFYLRLRPEATEKNRMAVSRGATIFWGIILFFLAILTQFGGQRVLELGLSIASVPYGGLLGVFLLGVLTKRANQEGAIIGITVGVITNLFLWLGPKFGLMETVVAWTWYVVIGTTLTFTVGYLASLMFPKPSAENMESVNV
ncbi:MAG TPA: sodium:solute symporter [Terriglobales bacterium]|nr:sodium:solute symporter [Terriglobales bacterium]